MMPHLPIESLHPPYQLFQNKQKIVATTYRTPLYSDIRYIPPHIHNPPSSVSNKHSN